MQTESNLTFSNLALSEPIQRAIRDKGYTSPSPIQAKAIPHLLEGKDLIGLAQTGTGKTAAFALPMLEHMLKHPLPRATRRPRALILTPTRELAIQIGENIAEYGRYLQIRHTLVFGGVGEMPQVKSIAAGTDILVATPGRLLDLLQQKCVFLDKIEIFVLDEADRMLDMGFAPDVRRVISHLPPRRQSLLFSATMPETIRSLAASILQSPVVVEVARVGSTVDRIEQRVCFVERSLKHKLLVHILRSRPEERVIVFARTKHGADRIAKNLVRDGLRADAIHGNKSQGARQRALKGFSSGELPVLVATDIASRGIDVKDIGLVVNFDLPEEPEAYVHRIGRTARAGASGLAIAFCDHEERPLLRDIQKLIRMTIQPDRDHPFANASAEAEPMQQQRPQRRPQQGQQQRPHQKPAEHRQPHHPSRPQHSSGQARSSQPQARQEQRPQQKSAISRLFGRFSRG